RLARREVTMIFQSFNLLMQRTCLKNVCFPMELAGIPGAQARKRAVELLELVGLGDKADAYPAQLSGGQKQRVAIARALATDPKVLLCDEATSALDPTTTVSILSLLKDLNEKLGVTVVVITHQMSVIEEICSRVAILDGGVVAEQGSVQDIFSNPSTDAARRLVYPGGVRVEQVPASSRAVRISFNGGTVYQPLIASLAIDCGVKVNILGADTRNINGHAFGTMLLSLPEDPNEAAKALSYIRSQPNVTAEEVEYHG
ncbi:MAG: ATP-binding cassette domain-containing protein, partial [Oscillospiraceae bacterium]|nr:ATP-binding cassette domain-containing protein [Oscillospiraceae bacterium]